MPRRRAPWQPLGRKSLRKRTVLESSFEATARRVKERWCYRPGGSARPELERAEHPYRRPSSAPKGPEQRGSRPAGPTIFPDCAEKGPTPEKSGPASFASCPPVPEPPPKTGETAPDPLAAPATPSPDNTPTKQKSPSLQHPAWPAAPSKYHPPSESDGCQKAWQTGRSADRLAHGPALPSPPSPATPATSRLARAQPPPEPSGSSSPPAKPGSFRAGNRQNAPARPEPAPPQAPAGAHRPPGKAADAPPAAHHREATDE